MAEYPGPRRVFLTRKNSAVGSFEPHGCQVCVFPKPLGFIAFVFPEWMFSCKRHMSAQSKGLIGNRATRAPIGTSVSWLAQPILVD